MAGPFFNAIKGTTAGTPGTGAFTPNAASTGFLAWSTVPTGWVGMVRYEDGTAWELQYSYWNGTTLSRAATTQFVSSSSGSALTLTSAATAAMVADANEIAPHQVFTVGTWFTAFGLDAVAASGILTASVAGTFSPATFSAATLIGGQPRISYTSATTLNAQSGVFNSTAIAAANSTAGLGGYEFSARFGGSVLVTGQRMFAGVTSVSQNTPGEPSALVTNMAALGKDSTDTNFQFLTKDGTTASKTNTGIPFVANGLYEVFVWSNPGSLTVFMLLIRRDTGAIYYGSKATNAPLTATGMFPQIIGGLATTTGTAFVLQFVTMSLKYGGF